MAHGNDVRTYISRQLEEFAASYACRLEMTIDGYIEVFPIDERCEFSGGQKSLICYSAADVRERLLEE